MVKADLDSYVLANTIIAMHNGVLLQWYIKHDEVEGPQLARTFRSVLLTGIAAGAAEAIKGKSSEQAVERNRKTMKGDAHA
jgi:hypothetical protein